MLQIVSFGVAALYSGMWWLHWARAGGLEGALGQLGLLSGLVCVGSVAGAVAWAANMQGISHLHESGPGVTLAQSHTLLASYHRLFAVFLILYGFEFLCFIITKLMLLGRLANSATHSSQADVTDMSGVRRRWLSRRALPSVYRMMAGAVVVGSVVSMVADAVAGAYFVQQAGLNDQAAAACYGLSNDTILCFDLVNSTIPIGAKARTLQSVQASSEALTLLIVSVAFVVIVSWSVALFRLMERVATRALLSNGDDRNILAPEANSAKVVADTMQFAAEQRRRLIAACVIVLVTFPARAAFDLLQAYAFFDDPKNPACQHCDTCQSTRHLIYTWLEYTPEFRATVVALSSPLPLTLSLWLLAAAHARVRLITADVERVRAGDGV